MFKFKSVLTKLGIACAIMVAAPVALAQDIVVVDTSRVLRESMAGQDLYQKVQQIGNTMQSELSPEQQALQTEKNSLASRLQGKTQQDIQADTALVQQIQAYERKLQTNAVKADKRSRELAQTERNALNAFADKMSAAVDTVRQRKNAKLVLAKSVVYLNDATYEITDEVIQQLNQDAPTIVVTRVNLPDAPQGTPQ